MSSATSSTLCQSFKYFNSLLIISKVIYSNKRKSRIFKQELRDYPFIWLQVGNMGFGLALNSFIVLKSFRHNAQRKILRAI